jgi:hypothetical protein
MRAAAEQENSQIRRRDPDTYWTPDLGQLHVAAGHRPGTQPAQDCQSVRIYSSELCPRQDSNLRSRLRRGLLCTPLTSGNELPHAMIGGVSGATAWSRLPGRNGMSSNRIRRLHSKTHPLMAAIRYVGTPSAGHWRFGCRLPRPVVGSPV